MTYYRYKLLGDYEDQGRKIYKIEITPKVTGSPLLNGTIHIQDETCRIHAINTFLTKDNGMNFLDTLWMNVIFIPLTGDIWMKGTQNFTFLSCSASRETGILPAYSVIIRSTATSLLNSFPLPSSSY
jgi:hypothetical protein